MRFLALFAACGAGCALVGCSIPSRSAPGDAAAAVDATFGVPAASEVFSGECEASGGGEIHVTLRVRSGVDVSRADPWLAVMCVLPDGERSTRIVRVDPRAEQNVTLTGLGRGLYVARLSAIGFEGVATGQFTLGSFDEVHTSLSLAVGTHPLAALAVSVDRAAGAHDGSGFSTESPIYRSDTMRSLGALVVTAAPSWESSQIEVRAGVRYDPCDGGCGSIQVRGVEVRLVQGTQPRAISVASFDPAAASRRVLPGETVFAPVQRLPIAPGEPGLALWVSLTGEIHGFDGDSPDATSLTDSLTDDIGSDR